MKLLKPLVIERFGGEKRTITEVVLNKEKFTADVIIRAEQNFLKQGFDYPITGMESVRGYQACVLCELLDLRPEELNSMAGEDFIKLTNMVKGFFGKSVLEQLQEMLEKDKEKKEQETSSEKQQ